MKFRWLSRFPMLTLWVAATRFRWFVALGALPALAQSVPLIVPPGTPIQVSIEHRVRIKRLGEPVTARVVEPVFAFNKEVIPAGSLLLGRVARLDRADRQKRIQTIMNGDFTPQNIPQIRFDTLQFPDGTKTAVHTALASARGNVVHYTARTRRSRERSWGRTAIEGIKAGISSARQQITTAIRSPNKRDRIEEAAYGYLPYHPRFLPANTRVAPELEQPLDFGSEVLTSEQTEHVGTSLLDKVVAARLISPVSSKLVPGSKVDAIVSQPLYSQDRHLLLPEGARLEGTVVRSQPARWWRRGGNLRFTFQQLELPEEIVRNNREQRVYAMLAGVDAACSTEIAVDSEGGIKAIESNTRFIAPVIKMFIGEQSIDQDRNQGGQAQAGSRTWRALAGASGFGVVGSVASQFSSGAATGLGFYGLAWSVYRHVVARGHNVMFTADTPISVRFEEVRNVEEVSN